MSWRSKKQSLVALSSAKEEDCGLARSAQKAIWTRQLTTDLGSALAEATTSFEDNQSRQVILSSNGMVKLSKNKIHTEKVAKSPSHMKASSIAQLNTKLS